MGSKVKTDWLYCLHQQQKGPWYTNVTAHVSTYVTVCSLTALWTQGQCLTYVLAPLRVRELQRGTVSLACNVTEWLQCKTTYLLQGPQAGTILLGWQRLLLHKGFSRESSRLIYLKKHNFRLKSLFDCWRRYK